MTDVLKGTDFHFLGEKKTGKVRDIYVQPDKLILITTDRHSSFDRIIAHIPWKGQVLNQVSAWWFEQTKDIVPNAVLAVPDPNVTVARKLSTVPVEAVMRGYLTGVTDTSIWTRYQRGERTFGGITLQDGMTKNQKLPQPIFDPTTKEEGHDRAITPAQMIEEGLITQERFDEIKATATKLFLRGQEIAAQRGLILVDTKYEFASDEDGGLVLIDEIHTPDSSRYWQLATYESRIAAGQANTSGTAGSSPDASRSEASREPEYFDKEFLRLWFKEHSDPYKDAVLPDAPDELVREMSSRYIKMYEQITGAKFVPGQLPVIPRMENNLKAYAI